VTGRPGSAELGRAGDLAKFIVDGKPGIMEDEYEAAVRRFAAVGIGPEQA